MQYIRDNWNGKLSLKLTFYFNFIAVDLVALLPWVHMHKSSINDNSYDLMIYLFIVLLITCWSAVGVFNCVARIGKTKSTKNQSLSFFEKIALVIALLWLIAVIFQAYSSIKTSNEEFLHHKHKTTLTIQQ